jgi:hypothetical protein
LIMGTETSRPLAALHPPRRVREPGSFFSQSRQFLPLENSVSLPGALAVWGDCVEFASRRMRPVLLHLATP